MSDSDSDSSSSSDSEPEQVQAPVKTVVQDDSDSSDSDSSDDEKEPTKTPVVVTKAEDSDSDSDSDSSDDEKEEPAKTVAVAAKEDSGSDSDSDSSDDSDDEKEPTKTPVVVTKADDDDSDSDSSDDSDDEKEPAKTEEKAEEKDVEMEDVEQKFTPMKSNGPVTVLFDWNVKASAKLSNPRKRKLENASSKPAKKKVVSSSSGSATAAAASGDFKPTKDFNPGDFRSAELKDKTCNVFVKGISTNCFQEDIEKFFEEQVAKPVSVRHKWEEGRSGLAWITFATPEQASKAVIDCNNEYIKDRWVNTDWSEERKNNNRNNNRGPRNAHLKGTTNRIWVGNLHREVDRDTLTQLFAEKGVTTDVFIIGRDETRPQIAYVSFETTEIADSVVEAFNGHQLMDYTMRMDWAEERKSNGGGRGSFKAQELSEKPEGCVTCFVGRLQDNVDDDKLKELFKDCGNIEGIRYIERDGEFKGVAFVSFDATEATDAATKLNGTEFMGKNIRVDFAADRKKKEW